MRCLLHPDSPAINACAPDGGPCLECLSRFGLCPVWTCEEEVILHRVLASTMVCNKPFHVHPVVLPSPGASLGGAFSDRIILFSWPGMTRATYLTTLLHEAVHLCGIWNHGPAFTSRMRTFAGREVGWSLTAYRSLRELERATEVGLASSYDGFVLDPLHPERPPSIQAGWAERGVSLEAERRKRVA